MVFIFTTSSPNYNLSNQSITISQEFNEKSVILMIGDGLGFNQMELVRLIEFGKEGSLSLENLSYHLNVTTSSANNEITDSAAAATAMATGYKTDNGMISVSPYNSVLETILEISKANNKLTGVVTTTEITHATPAAFMSHVTSRDNYFEIARQIVEKSDVDAVLGGGFTRFRQTDLDSLEINGYNIVINRSSMLNSYSNKLFGLFSDGHQPYEIDRDVDMTPSLSEMTMKALDILDTNIFGFFLMVEGGRIDHACHENNKFNAAFEAIEFINAVNQVISYLGSRQDVLLIVTADHETGGLEILEESLNDILPSENNTFAENKQIRMERINNITTNWTTNGHTSKNVPYFSNVIDLNKFKNMSTIDNTDIFDIMVQFLEISEDETISRIFFELGPFLELIFVLTLLSIVAISIRHQFHK
ncbi:MAG: alkaline phosphatase [Candidatus Lokiarchaeota archaeon]|nr:alkaline phosphatase [Candidatus Lokiarchaeota archaeon]